MTSKVPLLAILVVIGCSDQSINPINQKLLQYGDSFDLNIGQSATLPDGSTILFESVPSDSRCPKGAECFWQGNAAIVLKIQDGADTLNTISQQGIARNSYTINLISLTPEPVVGHPIPQAVYVVRLVAVKN